MGWGFFMPIFIFTRRNKMSDLFRFGSADFSNLIRAETYEIAPCSRQDLDSYRDALGVLHRNALEHTATVVEFDIKMIHEKQMQELMSAIVESYDKPNGYYERCCSNVSYFDPESNRMRTGKFYIDSNLKFSLYADWDEAHGGKLYNETHFKFVEY